MNTKRHIIQSALECFAAKGYHHTTTQHVAEAAGIEEDSISLHFASKEEILLTAATNYYEQLFKAVTDTAARYEHDPKEGLIQQIMSQYQGLTPYHSFFMLLSREPIASPGLMQILLDMRKQCLIWFRDQAIRVYGPRIEPYAFDLSALLNSLVREYMSYMILNNAPLPLRGLSEYIAARLDDAARGVLSSQEAPMLTTAFVKATFPDADIVVGSDATRRLSQAMTVLLQRIDALELTDEQRRSIRDAAAVMKEETKKPLPRRIVMEGMLAVMKEQAGAIAVQEEADAVFSIISEFS